MSRAGTTVAAIALVLLAVPAIARDGGKGRGGNAKVSRQADRIFRDLDRNGNGFITPAEWPGNPASFGRLDRNDDGSISRNEFRRRDREARFDQFDRNGDGVITRAEWPASQTLFDRLDRNSDGRLTASELRNRRDGDNREREGRGRFLGIDRNGDGVITRAEWPGNDRSFQRHDRNGDGVISAAEFRANRGRDFDDEDRDDEDTDDQDTD